MVDSISGNSPSVQGASVWGTEQQQASQSVERVNTEAAQNADGVASLQSLDQVTISDEAKQAYAKEKDVLRLSRLAQRVKETADTDKVSQLKNMVDSGRINDYLRSINTESLAQSILNSPSGAFLR